MELGGMNAHGGAMRRSGRAGNNIGRVGCLRGVALLLVVGGTFSSSFRGRGEREGEKKPRVGPHPVSVSSWGSGSSPPPAALGLQSPTSISSSSSSPSEAPCEEGGDARDRLPPCGSGSSSGMLASFSRAAGGSFLSDSTSAFISSRSRFSLARRFWNQVMTCALLRPSWAAMWSRSAGDRYFW